MILAATFFIFCIAPADAADVLWRDYKEKLVWSGVTNNGKQVEQYQSERGTWTILTERGNKMCISAAGNKAKDTRGIPV